MSQETHVDHPKSFWRMNSAWDKLPWYLCLVCRMTSKSRILSKSPSWNMLSHSQFLVRVITSDKIWVYVYSYILYNLQKEEWQIISRSEALAIVFPIMTVFLHSLLCLSTKLCQKQHEWWSEMSVLVNDVLLQWWGGDLRTASCFKYSDRTCLLNLKHRNF